LEGNKQHENNEFDSNEMHRAMKNIQRALDESSIIAITDKHGTITYVNKAFCKISKYSEEELIGQNHRMLKSGYHPPEFYKGMWYTISHGHIWRGEVKNKAKDGAFYWVKTVIVPFFDDQKRIIEFISIRTDITEQKNLQEQLIKAERLSSIGELSARIAHDLRNPLSVIKSATSLLSVKNPNLDPKSQEYVKMITNAISKMSYQIEDVLDFVRVSSLKLENCNLLTILCTVIDGFSIPNTVKINLPHGEFVIQGDSKKLGVLFINLITNALDAVENNGEISIRIIDDGSKISVEIEDSGKGVPDEALSQIFEPLFTTKQTGTGLGLPSCKNIVEQHGGTIDVKTTSDKGTTFIVKLPKLCE